MVIEYANKRIFEHIEPIVNSIKVEDILKCPLCGQTINGKYEIKKEFRLIDYKERSLYYHNETSILKTFKFNCTLCRKSFIAEYIYKEDVRIMRIETILNYLGRERYGIDFSNKAIEKLSTSFTKILNESQEVDNQGFAHIAGMGYRKALEFLIKDYLISKIPEMRTLIEDSELGKCIKNTQLNAHLQKFKDVAYIAKELGNEETHYFRRYLKDKNSLAKIKKCIYIIVDYIIAELELMDKPKLPKKIRKPNK